tara:strand:- start:61 stop:186 length:126 start_codon:yes stop_codon:yes gene_type:complete
MIVTLQIRQSLCDTYFCQTGKTGKTGKTERISKAFTFPLYS